MVKHKSDESVHVCLMNPQTKRREILQATIDLVQLLKRYENIKKIRKEKEGHYLNFQKCMASANFLLRKIKVKDMPLSSEEVEIYGVKKEEKSVVAPVMKKVKKAIIKKEKKEQSENLSLDRQIENLQRKLNSL